jgi:DNA repair exonuclease SbcCD ATPase subunit
MYQAASSIHDMSLKKERLDELLKAYPDLPINGAKAQLSTLLQMKAGDEAYLKQQEVVDRLECDEAECKDLDQLKEKQKNKLLRATKESELAALKSKLRGIDVSQLERDEQSLKYLLEQAKHAEARRQWKRVNELKEEERRLERSYPRAVKLQTIIKQAEKVALDNVIKEINLHAQLYMDYFLEDVTVNLVPDNASIHLDVTTNGHESDINSLSGGELARVILAFTLAVAEINNVRLLLLDECVASLDQDTTTTVIETIRQHFTGTVICIAHQTTTGIFDKVIEL